MLNYHTQLRTLLLQTGVEVYFEAIEDKIATPCISYMEVNNSSYAKGNTLQFSNLSYQIKVWAETILEANSIAEDIDSILSANGFTRVSSQDMVDAGLVMKILRFNAIAYEKEA